MVFVIQTSLFLSCFTFSQLSKSVGEDLVAGLPVYFRRHAGRQGDICWSGSKLESLTLVSRKRVKSVMSWDGRLRRSLTPLDRYCLSQVTKNGEVVLRVWVFDWTGVRPVLYRQPRLGHAKVESLHDQGCQRYARPASL